MYVSFNWLKKYVDLSDITPESSSEMITKSGIEVDGVHYVAEKIENVVIGYVISCEKHPNADRLHVCQVDVGEETLQIICGAPNIAQGQKVAVAKPGAVLPGNFKIKKVKLRGVESNGMICSLQELGVKEQYVPVDVAKGIVVLPDDALIGQDVTSILNLDDAILELDLTPNRADALSLIGVAYDVAAILDKPIKLPEVKVDTMNEKSSDYVTVRVEDENLTPYYGAFIIKDVEIKPSPLWMRNYLIAAGIRPINNVVDITNYVLLEYGQPLHAFDYDRLNSDKIYVRCAKNGEKLVTLDDIERTLSSDHLVITDGNQPVALAGIMGGKDTEVHDKTKTILLEAAFFDAAKVRKAVQHTGLRSEASTRFEKGVDPNRVKLAGMRACELLQKYANGKPLEGVAELNALDLSEKKVEISTAQVNQRLGTSITSYEIEDIFRRLRFEYKRDNNSFSVTIPTRRGDISIFEDILEEIARIYGYDRLPYTLPQNSSQPGGLSREQKLKRKIKRYLQSTGLNETITYSLTNKGFAKRLISPEIVEESFEPIELAMPMTEDHQFLRLSILPELLQTLAYNRARSQYHIGYYELGSIFISNEKPLSNQPKELPRLAGALTGTWHDHSWQQEQKEVDFFVVKGIVEGLLDYLKIEATFKQAKLDDMHPGRCAILEVGENVIGFLGQIHPNLAKELDIKDTYVFDLNVEKLLELADDVPDYQSIPKYPSIMRDIAFVVDENVHAADIKCEIEKIGAPLVKNVHIFDLYSGENVDRGKKSIAFRLQYQHPDKTLTDKEVEASYEKIVDKIGAAFSATIRK